MSAPKEKLDLNWTLRRVFGKTSFRPLQRDVIEAALGRHDIFLQAATSFGKSLCFQLPAVVEHGITIVVSPLLALMKNQVAALRSAGVEASSINSTTSATERARILRDLECGHPVTRLLYVTPEYCAFDSFRRRLHTVHVQRELSRIAIDEAHCISEWGHDFRPSFQQLNCFRLEFPDVPIMCLTATATQKVRDDIIRTLELSAGQDDGRLRVFTMTTSRRNLHYEVRFKSDQQDHFDDFLAWLQAVYRRRKEDPVRAAELAAQGIDRPDALNGIIYTLFRRDCEVLASRLCSHGIGAKPYHAGLSNADREDHLRGWIEGELGYDIIVATTAFGMGIDKDNVRFVVHWQVPKSFEGFYQEAGRAGRDQKAAICILYYSREDRDRGYYLLGRDKLKSKDEAITRAKSFQALIDYCESTSTCRHTLISQYFGETPAPRGPPRSTGLDGSAALSAATNTGDGVEPVVACDFACDFHKEGPASLQKRKRDGLADEEWVSTQRESGSIFEEVGNWD